MQFISTYKNVFFRLNRTKRQRLFSQIEKLFRLATYSFCNAFCGFISRDECILTSNFRFRDMSSKRSLQSIMLSKLETVSILIPFLIFSVIKSAPLPVEPPPSSHEKMGGKMNQDFLFLLLSATGEHWKLEELREYLCREWYEPWPQLDWISKSLVPNLLNCISKVPISR